MGDDFQVLQALLEHPPIHVLSMVVGFQALSAVSSRLSHRLIDGTKTASVAGVRILFWTFEKRKRERGRR